MRLYSFMQDEHEEEIENVDISKENPIGIILKDNATIEVIRDYCHFTAVSQDETDTIMFNKELLIEKMLEIAQATQCFKNRSETEKQIIIEYIKKNSLAISKNRNEIIDI